MSARRDPSANRRRAGLQLAALGLEFSGSVIGGLVLGYYLDEWLGTHPWLFLVGTFGGLAAAVLRMMQLLKRYAAAGEASDDDPDASTRPR